MDKFHWQVPCQAKYGRHKRLCGAVAVKFLGKADYRLPRWLHRWAWARLGFKEGQDQSRDSASP